jgi:hypothetical protein
LLAPIIPSPTEVIESRVVGFEYEKTTAKSLIIPSAAQDINITNKENIGGTFSVLMIWTPNIGGPKKVGNTHTESKFIQPNTTCTFKVPEAWKFIGAEYIFTLNIFAPTKIENITTAETKYKSIIETLIE